mmetsp:Transcript_34789/g.117940  ORF Transcript_34789/g.117940 Transcript_34789/m.117940 type:complete len:391 (+) Transcript_34789:1515-2687(+)
MGGDLRKFREGHPAARDEPGRVRRGRPDLHPLGAPRPGRRGAPDERRARQVSDHRLGPRRRHRQRLGFLRGRLQHTRLRKLPLRRRRPGELRLGEGLLRRGHAPVDVHLRGGRGRRRGGHRGGGRRVRGVLVHGLRRAPGIARRRLRGRRRLRERLLQGRHLLQRARRRGLVHRVQLLGRELPDVRGLLQVRRGAVRRRVRLRRRLRELRLRRLLGLRRGLLLGRREMRDGAPRGRPVRVPRPVRFRRVPRRPVLRPRAARDSGRSHGPLGDAERGRVPRLQLAGPLRRVRRGLHALRAHGERRERRRLRHVLPDERGRVRDALRVRRGRGRGLEPCEPGRVQLLRDGRLLPLQLVGLRLPVPHRPDVLGELDLGQRADGLRARVLRRLR